MRAENIAADLGNDAAHKGEERESNPCPESHYLHKWWDLGWLECHPDDFGIIGEKNEQFEKSSTRVS